MVDSTTCNSLRAQLRLGNLSRRRHWKRRKALQCQRRKIIGELQRDQCLQTIQIDAIAIESDITDRTMSECWVRKTDDGRLLHTGVCAQRLFYVAREPGLASDLDQFHETSTHGETAVAIDHRGIA